MINLKTLHVEGTHTDFENAAREKIEEVAASDLPEGANPDGRVYINVTQVSHAHAIGPDGTHHWSAFLTIERTWWEPTAD